MISLSLLSCVYPEYSKNKEVFSAVEEHLASLKEGAFQLYLSHKNKREKSVELYNKYKHMNGFWRIEDKILGAYNDNKTEELTYKSILENIDFSCKNCEIEVVQDFLGVAYNDTYINEEDDFEECIKKRKSKIDNVDLALIQLKSKQLSRRVQNIIEVKKDIEPLKLDDEVFMIGYNNGFSMANTKEGIKSQFTKGNITQESDETRVLYSIPTVLAAAQYLIDGEN